MFKDSSNNKVTSNEFKEAETIIGQSVKVEGDFKSDGNVVVEGEVSGSLKTNNNLKVGDQAKIKASVEAGGAWVSGIIEGNIKVKESLELTPNAKINGDIETSTLVVGKGAIINGNVKMGEVVERTKIPLKDVQEEDKK